MSNDAHGDAGGGGEEETDAPGNGPGSFLPGVVAAASSPPKTTTTTMAPLPAAGDSQVRGDPLSISLSHTLATPPYPHHTIS